MYFLISQIGTTIAFGLNQPRWLACVFFKIIKRKRKKRMKKLIQTLSLAATFILFAFTASHATLATMATDIVGPQTVIDFSQFEGFNTGTNLDLGNGVTVTGNFFYGSFSYSLGYFITTPQNGYWYPENHYIASGEDGVNMGNLKFSFTDGSVSAVGAFLNYHPSSEIPVIAAYDINDNLLESYSLSSAPISTPSEENGGEFRGIVRNQEDIAYFTYTGGFQVLTDLTFATPSQSSPVPIPGTMWLLGAGLLGLTSIRRKLQ